MQHCIGALYLLAYTPFLNMNFLLINFKIEIMKMKAKLRKKIDK